MARSFSAIASFASRMACSWACACFCLSSSSSLTRSCSRFSRSRAPFSSLPPLAAAPTSDLLEIRLSKAYGVEQVRVHACHLTQTPKTSVQSVTEEVESSITQRTTICDAQARRVGQKQQNLGLQLFSVLFQAMLILLQCAYRTFKLRCLAFFLEKLFAGWHSWDQTTRQRVARHTRCVRHGYQAVPRELQQQQALTQEPQQQHEEEFSMVESTGC